MLEFAPYVGGVAAFLASLSYIPRCERRAAWIDRDLSLGLLAALTLCLCSTGRPWVAPGRLGDRVCQRHRRNARSDHSRLQSVTLAEAQAWQEPPLERS